MEILRAIKNYTTKNLVVFRKTDIYKDEFLYLYKEKFNALKNKGYIKNDKFEDDVWIIKKHSEGKINFITNQFTKVKLAKEFGVDKEFFNNLIKSYLLRDIELLVVVTIRRKLSLYKHLVLGDIHIKMLESDLKDVIGFGTFVNIEDFRSEYIDAAIENVSESDCESRQLTTFSTVFKFDNELRRFYSYLKSSKKYEDRKLLIKYYPIFLWWIITTIIPLRMKEFLSIDLDCLKKVDNGNSGYEYILTVKRSIKKLNTNTVVISAEGIEVHFYEEEIRIDEDLYSFINEYILDLKLWCNEHNLDMKDKLIAKKTYIDVGSFREKDINKDVSLTSDLNRLLKMFYKEVLIGILGFEKIFKRKEMDKKRLGEKEIELILPYDTRHLAIINAIYIGYDIRYVQRLAGHTDINTTYGYYKHGKEYAKSYAIHFVEKNKSLGDSDKLKLNSFNTDDSSFIENLLGETLIQNNVKKNKEIVEANGFCTFDFTKKNKKNNPCRDYMLIHKSCPYFRHYDNSYIEEIEKEVDRDIELLSTLLDTEGKVFDFQERVIVQNQKLSNSLLKYTKALYKKEGK